MSQINQKNIGPSKVRAFAVLGGPPSAPVKFYIERLLSHYKALKDELWSVDEQRVKGAQIGSEELYIQCLLAH